MPYESAEEHFQAAFERLVAGAPMYLPIGAQVTQNNVAREAGRSPSALRKDRYPELIARIQEHIAAKTAAETTPRADDRISSNDPTLKQRYAELLSRQEYETSRLISALVEIAQLRKYVTDLEQQLARHVVVPFPRSRC